MTVEQAKTQLRVVVPIEEEEEGIINVNLKFKSHTGVYGLTVS
jgi:outer membrane protein assembly factor BamA